MIRPHAVTITVTIALRMGRSFNSLHAGDLAVRGESLGHNLVHVVILVSRKAADKVYAASRVRQLFVTCLEMSQAVKFPLQINLPSSLIS